MTHALKQSIAKNKVKMTQQQMDLMPQITTSPTVTSSSSGYIKADGFASDLFKTIEVHPFLSSFFAALLSGVILAIFFTKKQFEQKNKQNGSGNQVNIQQGAGSAVVLKGYSLEEVKGLFQLLWEQNFPKLKAEAQAIAEHNMKKFGKTFLTKAEKRIDKKLLEKFSDPDVQFVLTQAIISSSRRDSEELRECLSGLIIERLKVPTGDFKSIIYNEAINFIGNLTTDHLKAITVTWLLTECKFPDVNNWGNLFVRLNDELAPFIDFNCTFLEIQYINYSPCGGYEVSGKSLFQHLAWQNYRFLQHTEINEAEFNSLELPSEAKERIFNKLENNLYAIKTEEINKVKETLDSNQQSILDRFIGGCYTEHLPRAFSNRLRKEMPLGDKLLKLFKRESEEGVLNFLELSLVGTVIAQTYYEITTGKKCNFSMWK